MIGMAVLFLLAVPFAAQDQSLLAVLALHGRYGYINRRGQVIIKPSFAFAWPFSEGLASAWVGDQESSKAGYIDATGKFVIGSRFDEARGFHDGLAAVA